VGTEGHLLEEKIRRILGGVAGKKGLFLAPNIPARKLANAIEACGVPAEEQPLALVDCSMCGSAKDCLLFGRHAIYYHNPWFGNKPGPGSIPYRDFGDRTFERKWFEVALGRGQFLCTTACGLSTREVAGILNAIRQAVTQLPAPGEVSLGRTPPPTGDAAAVADRTRYSSGSVSRTRPKLAAPEVVRKYQSWWGGTDETFAFLTFFLVSIVSLMTTFKLIKDVANALFLGACLAASLGICMLARRLLHGLGALLLVGFFILCGVEPPLRIWQDRDFLLVYVPLLILGFLMMAYLGVVLRRQKEDILAQLKRYLESPLTVKEIAMAHAIAHLELGQGSHLTSSKLGWRLAARARRISVGDEFTRLTDQWKRSPLGMAVSSACSEIQRMKEARVVCARCDGKRKIMVPRRYTFDMGDIPIYSGGRLGAPDYSEDGPYWPEDYLPTGGPTTKIIWHSESCPSCDGRGYFARYSSVKVRQRAQSLIAELEEKYDDDGHPFTPAR